MNVDQHYNDYNGHVYYFEPNDLDFGNDQDNNAVPLTPHLEDLCISMSLTAEIKSRDTKNGEIRESTISWVSYPQGVDRKPQTSEQMVNGGINLGTDNYLTTYYTEISADKYIDHELVEGLGVTNVNISFESWYTPTITINFIDIHGSALWGREEAIHDNGEITSDNLLGVFFTQPYPLFRLQVKGFLGHDVTYQLSVSSFKGRYNSQTGNFEATVQFIGYSYSLLTDIPLKCLSYVSELSYVGKKYWDDNVLNNPQWQLINADGSKTPPIKLYQLIERIKNAIGTIDSERARSCDNTEVNVTTAKPETKDPSEEEQIVPIEQASKYNEATVFNGEIGEVEQALKEFQMSLRGQANKQNQRWHDGDDKDYYQILILCNGEKGTDGNTKITLSNWVAAKYRIFDKCLKKYNEKHQNNKIVNPIEKYIKHFHDNLIKNEITFNTIQILSTDGKRLDPIKNLNKFTLFNGQYHLNQSLKTWLSDELQKFNSGEKSALRKNWLYCYMYPFGSISKDIEARKNEATSAATNVETKTENAVAAQSSGVEKVSISDNSSETDDWMEETRKKRIIDILGFEPTIGNFVKMMMCHLETFVEVMQECGDRIYAGINSGERTYDNLGVEIDATDIARGNKPYPWPALYNPNHKEKNKETSDGNQKGNNYEVLGWPNDFNAKQDLWEEKKVVLSIIEAIEKYGGESESVKRGGLFRYDGLPMTATDLFSLKSPFRNVGRECTSIEKLAPYLGLRAANVIGVGDNQCDSNTAKIIGYMDAINMIASYSKYDKLKEAIKPKGKNNSFVYDVIDVLTCEPTAVPSNETESGHKYNSFETIKSGAGNEYHPTRHPIFYKKLNEKDYTYSYTYSKSINTDSPETVSIVPVELLAFNGNNNPYNALFDGQKKDTKDDKGNVTEKSYDFNFAINRTVRTKYTTGARQNFIYTCNTDNLLPTSVYTDYTNDQLLYINNNVHTSKTFVQQIENFKKGEVKYKNYTVKGEDADSKLKDFFQRRYRVSLDDYCKKYNNWRMLTTKISDDDADYAKDHLCFSSDKKDEVTYDDAWFNTSSKLIKDKITKYLNEKTEALKKDGNDTNLFIRELLVKINETEYSLFGSKFYYQQNLAADTEDENNVADKCKAFLILTSIMQAVDIDKNGIFKNDKTSLIQYIQPCYVLHLGALLWRKRFADKYGEPLVIKDYEPSINGTDISLLTKKENRFVISTDKKEDCWSISDYYMDYDKIDISVRNKLINVFDNFVRSSGFATIIKYCELIGVDATSEDDRWQTWISKWNALEDKTKPSQWATIFSNIFGNYSSIVTASAIGDGLRLLFDENNKAMQTLKELYGLNGGFIVGRSTTKRIGQGNNEVKISLTQLVGYLSGFEQRISEIEEEATKKENIKVTKDEEDTTRDLCVSMYYSLKHLWDTWLLTADRKEFTIENFFNKNFIFIDSFYINMFNVIKLNAEDILDAYNNKDANLLNFLTYPTSKEGCMFFALPSFLDSNVRANGDTTVASYRASEGSEMSWKKENLRNVFTPIPYNNIGSPQLNNTFVFIYTHPWSNNASEKTDYKFDSYDMTPDKIDKRPNALKVDILPKSEAQGADDFNDYFRKLLPNNSMPTDEDELISARYGYLMPCFGVAVNRGNNYIFKSINVNMDSPKITNVSAQTWEDILTKTGADGSKRVFFHGQDIYSIYSQYSYACEIEMMGCAQIQPLMYFQLLNIPMWRGTYMIYKVTHNMQAGMMTTKFTGMKMSRRQAPYANGYFTVGKQSVKTGKVTVNGSGESGGASSGGKFAVGGDEMLKKIFQSGDYKITRDYGADIGGQQHAGIDITTSEGEGTKLYAPWDGTIYAVGLNNPTLGNWVTIAENGGTYGVTYAHCQKVMVTKGNVVKAGETVIATLGKTGGDITSKKANTPIEAHLHLELLENGKFKIGQGLRNHRDPSQNIGYVGGSETSSGGDGNANMSLVQTHKDKTDKIAIVGDSWGVGLGNHFRYCSAKGGIQVEEVLKTYLPPALKTDCEKVVICCGLNSLGLTQKNLTNLFVQMGKKCKDSNKNCYICRIPKLRYPSGEGGAVNQKNVDKLNAAISAGVQQGGYGMYNPSDDVSNNNLASDGFHLKNWSKLADVIKKG